MKKEFDVYGMTCASCQSHVEKACKALKGVSDVNVNLLKNSLTLNLDENLVSANDVIAAIEDAGYSANEKNHTRVIKEEKNNDGKILIFAIINLLILMYVSMGNMMFSFPNFKVFDCKENVMGFALIQFILVLPILYVYRKYFINGFKRIFKLSPNMDSLIAMGSSVSMVYGIYCLFMISLGYHEYHNYLYFESAGMILVFVSIGKYLEAVSKKKTTNAISKLIDLAPKKARIIRDGKEVLVNTEDVKVDDIVVIKKGDSVPVDGIVIEGSGSFDYSNITGESMPVYLDKDKEVYSATTLINGYLKLRATKVGEDSTINTIINLVNEASSSKAPISKLADKISGIFVPIIFVISLITFIVNFIINKVNDFNYVNNAFEIALNFSLTVIVIACPCALGLATPVAIMVSTGIGAENGLLIKNAEILEKVHNVKTIVLDKTGTITEGKPQLTDLIVLDRSIDIESLIYSLEIKSEHPLANALVQYTKNLKKEVYQLDDYQSLDGIGLRANIQNDEYMLGNLKILKEINQENQTKINQLYDEGKIVLLLTKNGVLISIIAVKDKVKESSKLAIKTLKDMNIKVIMLTGDNLKSATKIAKEVNVDEVISDVLPAKKGEIITSIKSANQMVAMVGDGVNDALALTNADLGISMSSGSQIAIDSSDIVLIRNDLLDVVNVINLSKRTIKTISLGLFWAFIYNAICVVLSTGIFFYLTNGTFKMAPMYGSIAMSISSVSVVLNALTINFFKPMRIKQEMKEVVKEKELIIEVDGMMCNHCTSHVENTCLSFANVRSAKASLENKNVVITYIEDINKEEIVAKIIEEGYEAK